MAKVAVRRVNEWDGPSMLKIYSNYVGSKKAPEETLPELQDYIRRIDKYTYGLGWLLCEINSEPAGFCHLSEDREDEKNLFSVEFQLYVKPRFLRMGVGTALWTLMRDMMELGSRKKVTARVNAQNTEALAFFSAMGFSESSRENDNITMVYELNPLNARAERPIKPYLLDSLDYEHARESAAKLVRA